MNQLVKFYSNKPVRIVDNDGYPWFVAKDVCDILELANHRSSIALLDDDERGVHTVDTPFGAQQMVVVNEPGLYSLILRSRKPEAKEFKRWITHEVLPSIRKHGAYMTESKIEEILTSPDTIIRLATELKNEQLKRKAIEEKAAKQAVQIGVLEPKAKFTDAFVLSHGNILVRDFAKHIAQHFKVKFGQSDMYDYLKEHGYVNANRYPAQRAIDLGVLHVTRGVHSEGTDLVQHHTTRITPKGQKYFFDKLSDRFNREREAE